MSIGGAGGWARPFSRDTIGGASSTTSGRRRSASNSSGCSRTQFPKTDSAARSTASPVIRARCASGR